MFFQQTFIQVDAIPDIQSAALQQYYRVCQNKRGTLLLFMSSPIIDRFSKFFHGHTLWTVCNNMFITYLTTP